MHLAEITSQSPSIGTCFGLFCFFSNRNKHSANVSAKAPDHLLQDHKSFMGTMHIKGKNATLAGQRVRNILQRISEDFKNCI